MWHLRVVHISLRLLLILTILLGAAQAANNRTIVLAPQASRFRFVVYGDLRFTNPRETKATNPVAPARAGGRVAEQRPAFVVLTGDLVLQERQHCRLESSMRRRNRSERHLACISGHQQPRTV